MAVPARALSATSSASRSSAPVRVTTARTLAEVEALRRGWAALQGEDLTADLDYFLTVARFHPEVVRPHVVVASRDGTPVSIVAAHLRRGWLLHRIGPWDFYRPTLRAIEVTYRGVLGDRSPETLAPSFAELRRSLEEGEADAVLCRYLEPNGDVHRAAQASVPFLRREHRVPSRPHWSARIGSSLEETLRGRSSKTRENIRRISRRLTQELGPRLRLEVFRAPADAPRIFADVDAVAARTYQRRNGSIFRDAQLERELALLGLERGWFRAYVLYVDESPIAFWTGFAYGRTFGWRGTTGYDPAHRRFSPGIYVLTQLLDDLSHDPAIQVFDIGGGDVDYKRYFGDERWEEVDVRLFAPGLRLLAVNAVGSTVNSLHCGLRRSASALGAHGSATRIQRKRLKQRTLEALERR